MVIQVSFVLPPLVWLVFLVTLQNAQPLLNKLDAQLITVDSVDFGCCCRLCTSSWSFRLLITVFVVITRVLRMISFQDRSHWGTPPLLLREFSLLQPWCESLCSVDFPGVFFFSVGKSQQPLEKKYGTLTNTHTETAGTCLFTLVVLGCFELFLGLARDDSFSSFFLRVVGGEVCSVHDFGRWRKGYFSCFYFEGYYVFTVFSRELHSTGSGS